MARLRLDVRIVEAREPGATTIAEALLHVQSGDREAAMRGYRDARARGFAEVASLVNLAALAIGLDDPLPAIGFCGDALRISPSNPDAWVNLGVARWHAGKHREAAQATLRARALAPRNEAAAINAGLMLRSVREDERAAELLRLACTEVPSSPRLALAHAEAARACMQHDRARAAALRALALLGARIDPRQPGRSGLRPAAGADVRAVLGAACDVLDRTGVVYHLMAGTLLAIAKDGQLFPHDKDVDLALPGIEDDALQSVRAAFADDPAFRMFPATQRAGHRPTVVGLVHVATAVGVDLMLPTRDPDGGVRNETGWPDRLTSVLRPYAIGRLHWDGRDWPVPEPHAQYLADMYGEDWREQSTVAAGIRYDRCYSDTMLSNPSRTSESVPRAVNLGLLRLAHALQGREWSKAVAYCAQLLAREELPEVRTVLDRLQAAGHDGMRFDG